MMTEGEIDMFLRWRRCRADGDTGGVSAEHARRLRPARSNYDAGGAVAEYGGVVLLVGALLGVVTLSGFGGLIATKTEAAVCRALQREDCEDGGENPVVRPVQHNQPQFNRNTSDLECEWPPSRGRGDPRMPPDISPPDYLNADCGMYEVDDHSAGYRIYMRQAATELLAFTVYDSCDRIADSEEEIGRCILSFLRNLDQDNVNAPEVFKDQLGHISKGKRSEDFMDAIKEVREAAEDGEQICLAVSRTWGFNGQTNWDTRDSDDGHCIRGTDPTQGADLSQLDTLLGQIDSFDDFETLVNNPSEFVETVVDSDQRPAFRAALPQIRAFVSRLGEVVKVEELLDDLENDFG